MFIALRIQDHRWWAVANAWYWLLILVGLMLAGCGRYDIGSVSGVVRLDGLPLPNATVTFTPQEGRASVGKTDESGRYTLQYTTHQWGATFGRHQVTVTTRVDAVTGEDGVLSAAGCPEMLPARYHQKTELSAEVKPGRNTIDFELSSAVK